MRPPGSSVTFACGKNFSKRAFVSDTGVYSKVVCDSPTGRIPSPPRNSAASMPLSCWSIIASSAFSSCSTAADRSLPRIEVASSSTSSFCCCRRSAYWPFSDVASLAARCGRVTNAARSRLSLVAAAVKFASFSGAMPSRLARAQMPTRAVSGRAATAPASSSTKVRAFS